jgi:hypothetical protein
MPPHEDMSRHHNDHMYIAALKRYMYPDKIAPSCRQDMSPVYRHGMTVTGFGHRCIVHAPAIQRAV